MIGEPPLERPSFQVNPITDAVVTKILSSSPIGASGTNTIIAPFPTSDSCDSP